MDSPAGRDAAPRVFASVEAMSRAGSLPWAFSAQATLAADWITAASPHPAPVTIRGRSAPCRALATRSAKAFSLSSELANAASMRCAIAKPVRAMSAGDAWKVASAMSSMRIGSTEARKTGLLLCWAWPRIPASCQSGMFASDAMEKLSLREAWRSASATRAAVFETSSPSTSTASAVSMSVSVGMRAPPARCTARVNAASSASRIPSPLQKLSSPTSVRRAKLASTEALGEPMPTTRSAPSAFAAAASAAPLPRASNTPSASRTPAFLMRVSAFTKCEPKRPRSHRK